MPTITPKTEINRARSLSRRAWPLQVNLAPSQAACAQGYRSGRWLSPHQIIAATRMVTDGTRRFGRVTHSGHQTRKTWLWVRDFRDLQSRENFIAHEQGHAIKQDPHTTRHQAFDITWAGWHSFAATAALASTDETASGDRNRTTSRDKTWFQTATPGWILYVDVDTRGDEIIWFQYSGACSLGQ